jgi:hypothetical protein
MSRKLIIEHPLRDEVEDLENFNFAERAQRRPQPDPLPQTRPPENRPLSPVTHLLIIYS